MKRYLNVFIVIMMMLSIGSLFADTWTEDFDTEANWSGGAMGSYNAKEYTNPSAPGGLTFSSNQGIREPAADSYSGAYSWRIKNVGESYFLADFSNTLNGFSVYMARWDNSPVPNVDIEYSIDGGTTFTLIETITGDIFSGDKVYQIYTHTFASPISPAPGSTIQIRLNTTAGERMRYDDFTVDYGQGGTTPVALSADFSSDFVTGLAPLTINFTPAATGGTSPYSYAWDFDNNGTTDSNAENPSHTYTTAGTYSVKLTVTDAVLASVVVNKTDFITVLAEVATEELVVNGNFEQWTDATHPVGWSVLQNVNQEATTVHGGSYSVKHTAAGTKKFSQDVTGIIPGQEYTISYWYLDNDPVARSRSWSFWLNGTTTIADNLAELRPDTYSEDNSAWQQFTYTLEAPAGADGFRFEVRTYGASGDNYFDDFSVMAGAAIPTALSADFTANVTAGEAPLTVNFTNLVTGGTTPYTYSWDFDGNGTEDSSSPNPSYTYTNAGTYPVTLDVMDNETNIATETKTAYITVTTPGQSTYYTGITATEGAALRSQLKTLISTNTSTSYDGARAAMYSNIDNVNNTVTCVYTGDVIPHNYGNTSAPSGINCEHTYAQSWIEDYDTQNEVGRAKADVHHLYPTLSGVNSSRGNLSFDNVNAVTHSYTEAIGYTSYRGTNIDGTTVFEPADQHKGDLARALFYMNVRYNIPLAPPTPNNGPINVDMLETLLAWHNADPVDAAEILRNDKIADYQTNRNPFVDHPEWVTAVYGGEPVYTCATPTINPNGGTFTTAQTITISSVTEAATIYYTLNGSDPTSASTLYTAPFTLTDDANVKAFATKAGFEDSAVASANFVIDIAGDTPVGMFISEYIEGTSSNKAVEIYNGTGAEVDLTPYSVRLANNGNDWDTTCDMTGTLAAGDVYVISNASAAPAIVAVSNETSTITYYNGDDAVGLFYSTTLIDIVGVPNLNPLVKWDVAGVEDATAEHTLVRKNTVTVGNTDWSASAGTDATDSEWIVYPQNTFTYLGSHGGTEVVATPVISPDSGSYTDEVEITITCPTADATIYFTTNGNDPTTASALYTAPFTLTANATVKALAMKAGYDDSAIASADYTIVAGGDIPVGMIISEYVEGNVRNNKAIEIYNGTGAEVDLTAYTVKKGTNGGAWSTTFVMTGTLAIGDVYVIAHLEADAPIQAVADLLDTNCNFNGNDPVGLFYNDVLIDVFGTFDSSSNSDFDVAGVSGAAKDHTLVRKMTVTQGTTDWAISAGTNADDSQWIVYPAQTFNMLGTHSAPLAVVATPVINPNGGTYNDQVEVAITTTTPGAAIYYTIDNSTPTVASTPYTAPFTLTADATVKAIAVKAEFVTSAMASANFTVNQVTFEDGITVSQTAMTFTSEVGLVPETQAYTLYMQGSNLGLVEVTGDFQIQDPDGFWGDYFFFELQDEEVTINVKFNATTAGTVTGQIIHTVDGFEDVIIELTGTATVVLPTSIYDIQYTTVAGTDNTYPSLLNGQTVLVEGVVTVTNYKGLNYFISSPTGGAWNSVYVYDIVNNPTVGDFVSFKAVVDEYFGWTELKNLTEYQVISQGNAVPAPLVITTAQLASSEAYESVLVTIQNLTVTATPDIKNQWFVTDGSGPAQVDDEIYRLLPDPAIGDAFTSITGVVDYSYSEYAINPRSEADFVIGGGVTELATPVITSIVRDGTNMVITWDAVEGANSYDVYAANTPNALEADWALVDILSDTTISYPASGAMKFFKVKAFTSAIAK